MNVNFTSGHTDAHKVYNEQKLAVKLLLLLYGQMLNIDRSLPQIILWIKSLGPDG